MDVAASYVLSGVELVEFFDWFAVEFAWKVAVVLGQRLAGLESGVLFGLESGVRLRLVVVLVVVDFLLGQLGGGERLLLTSPERLLGEETELSAIHRPLSHSSVSHNGAPVCL